MSKEEQMYRLISEYRESGQSAKSFSTSKQIKHSTFQYWIHKEKRSRETAFVPVKTGEGWIYFSYEGYTIFEIVQWGILNGEYFMIDGEYVK